MSATLDISQIVGGWTEAEQKQALAELARKLMGKRSLPLLIEDVGYLTPMSFNARLIEFDDSTPYLREMRRRAETPEDSISLDQLAKERANRKAAEHPE